MRHLADLIAPTGPERDHRPVGAVTCAVFILALTASISGAAYLIGASVADRPVVTADAGSE